ncbi:hypothetical protein BKK51_08620 [Rodentibacter trehalosifermentans]|uniref:Labile enterotoxin output A n=1 Tax=Rodentibacter trehalosifermentans TaxID=1908263 RepID=A0A1V3IQK6_9PAST|nr:LeoA/HP0731 family dynamin-like GTPase [Rodentibacter trehalosifermentans]OOF44538.1 hypothetical protein BKK51_08620 [Rodentibacter trehalosifermentans]OOF50854.1 hypothetical protein BKK52_01540 [Rodentibacter trehalosifermentans]
MSNTLNTFKIQQEKSQKMLKKLGQFIERGREFGLSPNPDLLEKLNTAAKSVEGSVLKVALIGGFSEGKTSIASAWLERLDQSMKISQQESSNEVKIYTVDGEIELIDTPGLFGFKEQQNGVGQIEKYKEMTKKYVSEAHLVLYVMNSANPIKESHQEDLQWLFRDLNLLPRTVFVLSRFDEVADVEDDWDYRENLKTKTENVLSRLKSMIGLTEKEAEQIKIVGVSANPFGEGTDYWLDNLDEFKKLSRISTLQDATRHTIEKNGGVMPIVFEAQKSMIQDVLGKQLPILKKTQETLDVELEHLANITQHLSTELEPMAARINNVRASLKGFVLDYLSGLIRQVKGTDLNTFSDFYESELGNDGIVLNTRIEQEFDRQCQVISTSLQRISLDFNNEMVRFETSLGSTLMSKGLGFLSKQKLTSTHILAARDGIVSMGKIVGADLAKYLKFKPWGATNLAARVNVFFATVGIGLELLDSYKKAKAEEDFAIMVKEIVTMLEEQREGLLNSLNDDNFVSQLFPRFVELKEQFQAIQTTNSQTADRRQAFNEWQKEGAIIEGEYRILEQ